MKKIFIIFSVFAVVIVLRSFAVADTVDSIVAKNTSIYRFHLYYDNGQLYANRDFKFKYDIIPNLFVPEKITTGKPFSANISSVKSQTLATFKFDPQKGNLNFKKGVINVDGPYFADASKVNFYNDKGQFLLTLDLSGSSFCNDNGICNADVGENYVNCPNDCPAPTPLPTLAPTPVSGGKLFSQPLFIISIVVALVIIVVLMVWFIIKKKRKEAESVEIPPSASPLSQ